MSRAERGTRILAIALFLLASHGADAVPGQCCTGQGVCAVPTTAIQMMACEGGYATEFEALAQNPPWEWYLRQPRALGEPGFCTNNNYLECTTDPDCAGGACVAAQSTAKDFVKNYMSCCRQCIWDMQFPDADPIQVSLGPVSPSSSELAMVPKYLNCTTFRGEFSALDTTNTGSSAGVLGLTEFKQMFQDIPLKQMVANRKLDMDLIFWTTDFNKDGVVSPEEFIVLRHFITPMLLSETGPAQDGEQYLADGPLGGLFYDKTAISVWVTTSNNILMRLYLANRWPAAKTREPRALEEKELKRSADLDHSLRISLEEHYYRVFADINRDGLVERWEFDLSLYGNYMPAGSGHVTTRTWEDHDLNNDGYVTFVERKRIFADFNNDGFLDRQEWFRADFPQVYGPFERHANDEEKVGPIEYAYYALYHKCTMEGSTLYSRPLSEYPWHPSCPITFVVRDRLPWVINPERVDGLPYGMNDTSPVGGYAMRVLSNITKRLVYKHSVEFVPSDAKLEDYMIDPPNPTAQSVRVALLTEFDNVPANWTCSGKLWMGDGIGVVVNSADKVVSLYLVAAKLVISPHFVNFFCSLFFAVLLVGHIIWVLERWTNQNVFRPFYGEGVMDGLWWAMVTQTTVGYGDKAPVTGQGKIFAIFWMLFGLIMFGVFSGQVADFIDGEVASNRIQNAASLAGFSVGVLEKTRFLNLQTKFGFSPKFCAELDECLIALKTDEVQALLVPRADAISHFRTRQFGDSLSTISQEMCGAPFRLSGKPVPQEDLLQARPAVRVCAFGKSVHSADYLTEAFNSKIEVMHNDGSLASILYGEQDELFPPAVTDPEKCQDPSAWELFVIIPAAVLFVIFAVLNHLHDSPRSRGFLFSLFAVRSDEPSSEALSDSQDSSDTGQMKTGKVVKPLDDAPGPPMLVEAHVTEMIEVTKKLGIFTAMQASDIRRMQKELREQGFLLERMLKFFVICASIVVASLGTMVGLLIVIWGDQIQVADYS